MDAQITPQDGNADERIPFVPNGLTDEELTRHDRAESPGSERETAAKQDEGGADAEGVQLSPGTGGPDDVGSVEVDESELNLPQDRGAH